MLSGEHVCLRAIERSDLPTLLGWRNQPQLRQYFREHRELNAMQQEQWFSEISQRDSHSIMFAVCRPNGELIGACGLCYIHWVNRSAECSVYIGEHNRYVDDVHADDAVHLMVEYAFAELNLHRLFAEIYDFDQHKEALFINQGFQLEGRLKHSYWSNNSWHDSLMYGLINDNH